MYGLFDGMEWSIWSMTMLHDSSYIVIIHFVAAAVNATVDDTQNHDCYDNALIFFLHIRHCYNYGISVQLKYNYEYNV